MADPVAKKRERMPQYPDFPAEEYQQRYARARTLMDEAGLDSLLITEELNYIYFTGHRSQQNPIDKIRPYVYILPKDDEGALITMPFEIQQVRETTWIEDVRQAGLTNRVDVIVSVLEEKGLGRGRIGAELGSHQYLGISYNDFLEIQKALPNAEFRDAAPVLLKLRCVKSPDEVEYIRIASSIVALAMAKTFESVRAGMTEVDVMCRLRTLMAELGAENVTFMWVVSAINSEVGGGGMNAIATNRRLEPGDMLTLDAGVAYRGYCSDVARSSSVGRPRTEVADFYSWMMAVRHECSEVLRAGKTPRDVVSTCQEAIAERGATPIRVGRIGHGVGLESTEYPSLALEEDIQFEPGMVFSLNPNFIRPFGWVNSEDQWLVTSDRPELLSSPVAPDNLPIVAIK